LCKNSDLCAEITTHAAHTLDVDAAIIFSDLLVIVEPLGFELTYGKDQGPLISNPFRHEDDLKRLNKNNITESLTYVYDAVRKTCASLKPGLPLIGFAGAPFTMASYLIEGKGSKNFINTKKLMMGNEPVWNQLLGKLVDAAIIHLNNQIAAGAQAVQLFDSWVGCLSPGIYRTHVLPHMKRLIQSITPGTPVINFGTQTTSLLPLLKEAGGHVIGLDWRVELDQAWATLGDDVAVMGNLDPTLLFTSKKIIEAETLRILKQADGRPGHIFNLGHGVLPETPLENVLALIEIVKNSAKPS
jgi:uroporphyrinogen decarboxylase